MKIPLKYIKSDEPTYIWLIGLTRDFYYLTKKLSPEKKLKYIHIKNDNDWRWRRFEELYIISGYSDYSNDFRELEKNAKFNLIK